MEKEIISLQNGESDIYDETSKARMSCKEDKRAQCTGKMWTKFCAGFRRSAGFHARVVLDGAACRLGELGDVHYVLGVLGGDHIEPIVLRVLV